MSKFNVGDRAVFNCSYNRYRPGDEVVVTGVSSNYTHFQGVKGGKEGSCYHWRLDKVVAPMLPLTVGQEPATGEQYLDRAVEWLSDNSDDTYEISVQDAIGIAQFLRTVDETNKQ